MCQLWSWIVFLAITVSFIGLPLFYSLSLDKSQRRLIANQKLSPASGFDIKRKELSTAISQRGEGGELPKNISTQLVCPLIKKEDIWVLGEAGNPEVIPRLISIFMTKGNGYSLRDAAVCAVAKLCEKASDNSLVELLVAALSESEDEAFIYDSLIIALGNLGDRRAIKPLILELNKHRSPTYIAEALVKFGADAEEALPVLEKALAEEIPPELEACYDRHGGVALIEMIPNPSYETIKNGIAGIKLAMAEKHQCREPKYEPPKGVNMLLLKDGLGKKRIDVYRIRDYELRCFLEFLKMRNLHNILVMGGSIRDIFFDECVGDIDITIKVNLDENEQETLARPHAQVSRKIYDNVMQELKILAQALGIEVEDLQRPASDPKIARFKGLEIQYAGPIEVETTQGNKGIIKRFLVDGNSRKGFASAPGASLLQMGIDCEGNLYGCIDSLVDLAGGKARIIGNKDDLAIGDILRMLRLKHQFGLHLLDSDYQLMKETMQRYMRGEKTISSKVREVAIRQMEKVLTTALDKNAAQKEMEELGVGALLDGKFDANKVSQQFLSLFLREFL